ncbi:hypothetical protein Cgig2_030980 [Carnegiea gigantea]|uniref:Probable magnesium transporter n=1 Tax=Carnegiea gigantea TaxID=171969 RepID=A0A9Q1KJM4_9CARY|nr:hypothetical protein Cgig2_030980 [Carnegiea gigantea]
MYSSNLIGVILACVSSAFIGSSFIIKKKGLKRAGASGPRASVGGYGYLLEPLWWVGMVTMIAGEIANFVAYIYAPAVLVTPLGALSIIVSAVLAHCLLDEKLQKMGMLGCLLCIVGSTIIVLHAPGERSLESVDEIWGLAIQPAFLLYTASVLAVALVLILYCAPRYGQTNILVYIGICSVIGSLTVKVSAQALHLSFLWPSWLLANLQVMSVKAIGIAIKLTLEGANQFKYFQSWVFAMVSVTCIVIQLNYLNMEWEEMERIGNDWKEWISTPPCRQNGTGKATGISGSSGMRTGSPLMSSQSSDKITSSNLIIAGGVSPLTTFQCPPNCRCPVQEASSIHICF